MDIEKARAVLDDTEADYEADENSLVIGVAIIGKYHKGKWGCGFEHDQMWFGDFEETVKLMTEEEVTMLAKLGWFEDEESWSLFS
jgi:hypothetical protein